MQYPGSPPPGSYAPGDNALGPQAGDVASQDWKAGEVDIRPIVSAMRAPNLWRLTVLGSNVLIRISYGTHATIVIDQLRTPIRVTLPGSVDVYARPRDPASAASVRATLTPVTSGCCDSECRAVVSSALNQNLDDNAVRFVALLNSTITLETNAIALTPLQSVALVAGAALTAGYGYLEYEP